MLATRVLEPKDKIARASILRDRNHGAPTGSFFLFYYRGSKLSFLMSGSLATMTSVVIIVNEAEAANEVAGRGAAGLAAARQTYEAALGRWTAEAMAAEAVLYGPAPSPTAAAAAAPAPEAPEARAVRVAKREAVAQLWLAWASLEVRLKQFKQAFKVFEQVNQICHTDSTNVNRRADFELPAAQKCTRGGMKCSSLLFIFNLFAPMPSMHIARTINSESIESLHAASIYLRARLKIS